MKACTKLWAVCWAIAVVLGACQVSPAQPVVFTDDFEDNDISDWSIGPCIMGASTIQNGHVYDPATPSVSGGKVWGKGSGYGYPMYAWMTKEAVFNASDSLVLEVVGESGTGWPNQSEIYLMTDAWPTGGEVYTGAGQFNGEVVDSGKEGYCFRIYGESNQKLDLEKRYYVGETGHVEYLFQWNHNVTSSQMYRVERDSAGDWSLYYGNPDGTNMQAAPIGSVNDSTFSSFGDVGIAMLRNQTALDSIEIQAVPEPATLGILVVGGLTVLRRRRRVC